MSNFALPFPFQKSQTTGCFLAVSLIIRLSQKMSLGLIHSVLVYLIFYDTLACQSVEHLKIKWNNICTSQLLFLTLKYYLNSSVKCAGKSPRCGISLISSPGDHVMSLLPKVRWVQHVGVSAACKCGDLQAKCESCFQLRLILWSLIQKWALMAFTVFILWLLVHSFVKH